VQGQGTLLQPERKPASVASELLDSYVGRYGQRTVIERRGDRLVAGGSPQIPPRLLTPVSDTEFYDKRGSLFTFGRNTNGEVVYLSLRDGLSGDVVRLERMR
jgi:hypothetical protein